MTPLGLGLGLGLGRHGSWVGAPPEAPVAGAATSVLDTSFTANWAASAGAESYRLDVSTVSNFSSFVSGYEDKTVAGTSQSVTGLVDGETYHYRVRAVNAGGISENSTPISVTTPLSVQLPTSPVMLYDGLTFDQSGGLVTAIPDTLDPTNENKKFKEATNPFAVDTYPTKTTQAQKMALATERVLSADAYSVIFAGIITGGSTTNPVAVCGQASEYSSITTIGSTTSSAQGAIGENASNNFPNNFAMLVHPPEYTASRPTIVIEIWSYHKTDSGQRSGYAWIKQGGAVVTTDSVVLSNDNRNTPIFQLGRTSHATNYSQYKFLHLSAYNKLLTAKEQLSAVEYLKQRFSL